MKTIVLTLLACFISYLSSLAQSKDTKLIYSATPVADSAASKWYYPSFINGKIAFRDGTSAIAPLNYNLLLGDIEFISPDKDTLAVADEVNMKYAIINSDTFFYNKIYLQYVAGNEQVKLARHQQIKLADTKKKGAYGLTTNTPGVTYFSTISQTGEVVHLANPEQAVFKIITTYYLGDNYNHFLPATKKNLYKMFDKKQDDIKAYLDSNQINLSKEDDLRKLVAYLQTGLK